VISIILNKIKTINGDRFLKNASWIGAAELINRVSRLITAIVLARYLTPFEFGLAAIALTANELIKVLAQNGIGAKVIQANDDELETLCDTAYRLNWMFCSGLFILQCLVAVAVAYWYKNSEIAYMIAGLALVYLMMPFALIQAFLIQRQNRLNVTATISATQTTIDNILTAVFAMIGMGVWAIVLPKILVAPVWVFGTLSQQRWHYTPHAKMKDVKKIFTYGKNILGAELAKVACLNVDNLIVAAFLGVEIAGLYYFAKNAGLGISLSLISAFNLSLFAHLCDSKRQPNMLRAEFIKSIKLVACILTPVILAQSLLADWYVPVVFGEQWEPAVTILMLLCLSAIPRPFGDGASELLKAIGRPDINFRWNVLFSILFVGAIFIGLNWGIVGVACSILLVHLLCPFFALWVIKKFLSVESENHLPQLQHQRR